MNHDEFSELVPIYALDALPAEDEVELTAHLAMCRECSDLLAEHRQTAGMLGLSAGSLLASPALRNRILQQAAQTQQVKPAPAAAPRVAPVRSFNRSWRWVGLAAGCALVLLVAGGLAQRISDQNARMTEQQTIIAQQREALAIIGSPASIVLPMTATDSVAGLQGKVFVSDAAESAAVVVQGLSDPDGDVYTLWHIVGGERTRPVADFLPEEGLALIPVPTAVRSDDTLAITREPRRGNQSPQGDVMIAAYRA